MAMGIASLATVDEASIIRYVSGQFEDVNVVVGSQEAGSPEIAWGDTFFIHKGDRNQFPFATIVTKDYGDFDNASNLNRDGVFRLNIGVSKETFGSLFRDDATHDFTALDILMPHPVYGRNHWVCVLNPSDATFESIKQLLAEAYDIAVRRAQPRRKI
jgi:hypothetical protein